MTKKTSQARAPQSENDREQAHVPNPNSGYDWAVLAEKIRPTAALRRILRPSVVDGADAENLPEARDANPKAAQITWAMLAIGAAGLGVYMAHEFFSQSVSVAPRAITPSPVARVPIPTPTIPTVRVVVSIADGRAYFHSFDTGPTRVVVSGSGRSITIVTGTLPIHLDVKISEKLEPVTSAAVNESTDVRGDETDGRDLSFEITDYSLGMDDPSVSILVHHKATAEDSPEEYIVEDQLQILTLSP